MLTTRGWWFFLSAVVVAGVGAVWLGWYSASVPVLGITLVVWFCWEWALFAYRYRSCVGRFRVERALLHGERSVPAAWAGHPFTVRVSVTLDGGVRLPFVVLEDRPPSDCTPDAIPIHGCELLPGRPAEFEYRVANPKPGIIRFEGVTVRVADLAGFFYRRVFVRAPVEYLVLPPLTDDEGRQRADKRFNTLPPPGVHRMRRPGSGSELLDLRDYRPGDPPKMIAWKASARRDRLITKEFESDVPVRCVLFLDASEGARIGPPGTSALVRLAGVAAGVAQAAAASRDLVGLTVFDDERAEATAPARTQAHIIRLMQAIADAAGRLPPGDAGDAIRAAKSAYPVAREIYPDVLAADVNSRPVGLFWRPISDSNWVWVVIGFFAFTSVVMTQASWWRMAFNTAADLRPMTAWWVWKLLVFGLAFFPILFLPSVIAGAIWVVYGVRGLFEPHRTRTSRRKQLGALYAHLDGDGPGMIEKHLHDDKLFTERTARFLRDHRIRVPVELFDAEGNYRFRSAGKLQVLADTIIRSVGRARDNELYVVLADVAELDDAIEPLAAAARVARARHHQMLVLVPWPAGVPAPHSESTTSSSLPLGGGRAVVGGATRDKGSTPHPNPPPQEGRGPERNATGLSRLVQTVLHEKYLRSYAEVRTLLTRAGASVVRVEDGDPVQLVLDRLDRLRGARIHR